MLHESDVCFATSHSCNGILILEDVNPLQPAHEFTVMRQHGREFVSHPEENPVILSENWVMGGKNGVH